MAYTYDAADKVTLSVWKSAAGVTVNLLTYTYDDAGNRLSARDAAGAVTYTYDELNRVKTYLNVFGQVLTYTYDAEDHATQREDPLTGVQTSTYNAVGRLTSRQWLGGSKAPLRVDFGYTNRHEQSTVTRYADLTGATVLGTSAYTYDDAGRLTGVVHKDNAAATLSYYTYTYDRAARIAAHTWASQVGTVAYSGTRTYTYDRAGQLASDGTATYTYDLGGNRAMAGYATGAANRLTTDGVFTYTYDAEGNLTQKSKGAGLEAWYYAYDHANHLTTVRKTSNGTTNTLLLTYTYDAEGKRVKEQSWGGTGPAETRFAYDGENVWADLDSGNAATVRRLYGDRPDQVVARAVVSGPNVGRGFYLADAQGSVRDVMDASSLVKAHLDYDGYGVRTDPQAAVSDRYGYTGREWQADAGVQHNRKRDYLPAVGRWMQEDPIEFAAGDFNLTRYVRNDPVNLTDPSGLSLQLVLDLYQAYQAGLSLAVDNYLAGGGVDGVVNGFMIGFVTSFIASVTFAMVTTGVVGTLFRGGTILKPRLNVDVYASKVDDLIHPIWKGKRNRSSSAWERG